MTALDISFFDWIKILIDNLGSCFGFVKLTHFEHFIRNRYTFHDSYLCDNQYAADDRCINTKRCNPRVGNIDNIDGVHERVNRLTQMSLLPSQQHLISRLRETSAFEHFYGFSEGKKICLLITCEH